jgi:hypothetical protein
VAEGDSVKELREALERAVVLMRATKDFIHCNPVLAEYTVIYDEAECDGDCLADDCMVAIDQAECALKRTVIAK